MLLFSFSFTFTFISSFQSKTIILNLCYHLAPGMSLNGKNRWDDSGKKSSEHSGSSHATFRLYWAHRKWLLYTKPSCCICQLVSNFLPSTTRYGIRPCRVKFVKQQTNKLTRTNPMYIGPREQRNRNHSAPRLKHPTKKWKTKPT